MQCGAPAETHLLYQEIRKSRFFFALLKFPNQAVKASCYFNRQMLLDSLLSITPAKSILSCVIFKYCDNFSASNRILVASDPRIQSNTRTGKETVPPVCNFTYLQRGKAASVLAMPQLTGRGKLLEHSQPQGHLFSKEVGITALKLQ